MLLGSKLGASSSTPDFETFRLFFHDLDDFGEGYIHGVRESRGRKSGDEELKGWKRLWDGVEVSRRVDTRVEHPRTPPAKRDETTLRRWFYARYIGEGRERELGSLYIKTKG